MNVQLNDNDLLDILDMRMDCRSSVVIAKKYGTSDDHIRAITSRIARDDVQRHNDKITFPAPFKSAGITE